MTHLTHWINGASYEGQPESVANIYNPATGQQIRTVNEASLADLNYAVEVAKEAQQKWAQYSLAKRVDIMFNFRQLLIEHKDRIAKVIVEEHGKTYGDAIGEIQRGRETVEFACGINAALKGEFSHNVATRVDVHNLRQPIGVVAGITPFNFPIMVPMWMHPIAIATGNAFILKPASPVPSAALITAELYKEAGLPDGVFNVVMGNQVVGGEILKHPDIKAISFVGSTPVARIIAKEGTANGKRVQALGGANNHAIVMPDADIPFAAGQIAAGAFGAAGERCMALPVVVAVGGAAEPLMEALVKEANKVVTGNGMTEGVEMGPVISKAAQTKITNYITDAEERGAKVVVDGRTIKVPGHEEGFFVGPTILDEVTTDMPTYNEEVFGPVLAFMRVDTYEEAIAMVNATPFGNGSAIFTNSGAMGRRFADEVQAGMVGINVPIPVPVAYYSFGGWKNSLMGDTHIHGPEGVRFNTKAKVVTTRWPASGEQIAARMDFPTHD